MAMHPAWENAQTGQARELTLRAAERFEAGDYEAALTEFSRAYELLAGDPRRASLLNNIAVCHERLFRYDRALRYYERYLREAESDPADRAEVEAVIRGLRGLLGKLHITSNVRAEIWIDDRSFGYAPGAVEVPAGRRVVRLEAPKRQAVQRELEVVARTTESVHFELTPLPEYHGVTPAYFWTGVGLTGAALITGAGLGLGALAKQRENERLLADDLLTYADEQRKKNLGLAADISFGVSALFAVGSTVLFFLSDFRSERERAPQAGSLLAVLPSCDRSSCSLQIARVWR